MNTEEISIEKQSSKKLIPALLNFAKNHKKLILCISIALLLCLAAIVAISIIHAGQAQKLKEAQIGKCYMENYDSDTTIHYFTEKGVASLRISYDENQRVDFLSGSLNESSYDYSFRISLFGTPYLDYLYPRTPVKLNERHEIIAYRRPWELITLEEALAIERQAAQQYKIRDLLEEACDRICNSAIGTEGFLERLNADLKHHSLTPSIADDATYITAAKSLLSEFLKNPSSAVYNSESVIETDSYGRAIVYLDVSAQNSFGGYVRSEHYICLQSVYGTLYTYNSMFYSVDSRSQLEYLKSANGWNTARSEKEDFASFKPGQPEEEGPIEVNGLTLHRYAFKSTKATYIAYIEPTTQYVVAAEMIIGKDTLGDNTLNNAVAGVMKATHDYALPQYDEVFDCDSGIISTTPFFHDKCGCMYHAVEKNGKYHISVTNIEALGCTKTNYWSPVK